MQKSTKEIYKANGSQLRYLRRNLGYINELLHTYHKHQIEIPLKPKDFRYIETID
jgi:transposase, IS5 family